MPQYYSVCLNGLFPNHSAESCEPKFLMDMLWGRRSNSKPSSNGVSNKTDVLGLMAHYGILTISFDGQFVSVAMSWLSFLGNKSRIITY